MKKKIIALALAVCLTASFAIQALAANEEMITGETTVTQPILSLTLPTTISLKLNPMGVDLANAADPQITAPDYIIKSTAAVPARVDVFLDIFAPADVTIDTYANVTNTAKNYLSSANTKDLALRVRAAVEDVELEGTSPNDAFTDGSSVADGVVADTVAINASRTSQTEVIKFDLGFVLDKCSPGETMLNGFRLEGAMNAYAPWLGSDLSISGSYKITALAGPTYDTLSTPTTGKVATSQGLLIPSHMTGVRTILGWVAAANTTVTAAAQASNPMENGVKIESVATARYSIKETFGAATSVAPKLAFNFNGRKMEAVYLVQNPGANQTLVEMTALHTQLAGAIELTGWNTITAGLQTIYIYLSDGTWWRANITVVA